MSTSTETTEDSDESDIAGGLRQLVALPDWLAAAQRPERVIDALERAVAEFASGELTIRRCKADRLRLNGDRWDALYALTVDGPDGQPGRELLLAGTLTPLDHARPAQGAADGVFGTAAWRCYLPELGLDLRTHVDDEELVALPILIDPEQARVLLEQSISSGSTVYADMRITRAVPKVLRNKPGRCTILYHLEYDEPDAAARWPGLVVAKTYGRDKGRNAYEAMRKLWASPLSTGDVVSIAEPLAYIPAHKVLVQGQVRGDQDFKDLLKAALRAGTSEALEELHHYTRAIAAGLAALHHSGAHHGEIVTWEDEIAEIRDEIEKLGAAFPWFAGAVEPLLARLEALNAAYPADPTLPTHRSFRPQQMLIHQGRIGFIDFDGFCLAEPALDIALFRATVKEIGINTSPSDKQKEFEYPSEAVRLRRLAQLDTVCAIFLAEYERLAPISRQRVALWEALDLLTVALRCWSKVKPGQIGNAMLILERHLEDMRIR
jgi:aminoglycoside phosphotransferase (APT) family kinase protein